MKRKFTFLIAAALMLLTMMATTGTMWGQTWEKATSIQVGDVVVLVTENSNNSTTKMELTDFSSTSTVYGIGTAYTSTPACTYTFEVVAGKTDGTFAFKHGSSYLYWASGNSLNVNSTLSANTSWTVSINGTTSKATIKNAADNTRQIWWNVSSPRFACYTDKTEGKSYYITTLYKQVTSGDTPSITANNVDIAYNATEGSIGYTLHNATGNVNAEVTNGDWLTLGTITEDEVPFTCSANEGNERTATVTLSFTGASNKVVTITQAGNPDAPGTQNNPYTVAQARAAIDANTGVDDVYTTGIISQVDSYNSTYYSITYWISDDGTTTNQLKVYSGKGLNNTNFSSIDDVEVGAAVVVFGDLLKYQSVYEINYNNYLTKYIPPVPVPSITATPNPLAVPNYVIGTAEPEYETLTVNGSNLTANISLVLNNQSNFELSTDLTNWTSSLTLTQNEGSVTNAEVAIRMKAGLAKGNYAGTVTLTSTDAEDVVVNLSGTVTGQTYTIEQYSSLATAHGTITFEPASPVEDGTEVTLTATPADGYDFTADSWVFYKESGQDYVVDNTIVVTNSKITMPAYNIWVDATFAVKPTYAITKVVTPANGGTVATDETAWEGKEVTVSVEAANGYTFSSIVISKTGEPETTIQTTGSAASGFTFTMPAYPVTVTATFLSNIFEGSFAQVTATSALEDGGYYILYSTKAMNSTVTSGKMGATEVIINGNNIIEDPDRSIVWKLVKNGDNWDLYSEKESKYCYIEGTNTSAFKMAAEASYHYVVTAYATGGGFKFKTTHSSGRGINYGTDNFGSYADSNSPIVYLYKYTTLTERTITFNGNGGTYNEATTYTQVVYDGVSTALTANQFTKANSAFVGWALTADGDVVYDDQAQVTINADLDLYAKWATSYTLTVDNNIEGGSVSITGSITSAVEGTEITLSYSPEVGHAFSAWNVYKTGDPETTVTVTDNKFNMPAYNVTVSATFVEAITYSLITDASQIVSGKHYIIANGTDGSVKVMARQNPNNRTSVVATATNNVIPETEGIYEFVINGPTVIDEVSYYTIYDTNEASTGYLYAAGAGGSSNNYLKTQQTNNNKGLWTISISNDNKATIKANETGRNWMRNNGTIFACYASGQSDIYLFVKNNDNNYEYYGSEITYSGTSIPSGETVTVGTGSVMTVTNYFGNDNPAALVIEDGGQVIVSNSGVQATFKKSVSHSAAKDANNWYTISSPVNNITPSAVTNLIQTPADNYDLYYYDEENVMWKNHKKAAITNLTNGKGYLYWNAGGDELSFPGELNSGNIEIALTKTGTGDLAGWNLIGNPYSHNIYKGAGTAIVNSVSEGYELTTGFYTLANSGAWVPGTDNTTAIVPGQGILVKATTAGTLTMTNTNSSGTAKANNDNIQFIVSNSEYEDITYALFNTGIGLDKINHRNAEIPMVYIPQNGQNYAIATMSDDTEMFNLNFKAMTTGQYTLRVDTKGNYSYLHIYDKMTNEDVDMLLEGEYSFIGSPRDAEDRFVVRLSYRATIDGNDTNIFAYQSGSDIIVNGKGELQVFDVNGRMVMNTVINGKQTVNIPTTGLYIFRMVGESVKTQKIVVR